MIAAPADPADVILSTSTLRLAVVAALQLLSPRQRAVLVLRDVLMWPAADVADALDMTVVAVNSTLQRARARTRAADLHEDDVCEPTEARAVVDRYVAAFENADLAALKRLLTDDAIMEMPPYLNWLRGADDYVRFIARAYSIRGTDWRMLPVGANGQPAVAAYARASDGVYRLHTLQIFTVTPKGVAHVTVFQDPAVFATFDLAPTLAE